MESQQPVHINIFKDNKEKIEASTNMSEAYIILANEEFNNRLRETEHTIGELNAQIETLTEDNARMEVTVTNQRGLLQNFHGLNKIEKKNSENYKTVYETHKEQIKSYVSYQEDFENQLKNAFGYFTVMILINLSVGIIEPMVFFSLVFSLLTSGYFALTLNAIVSMKSRNEEFVEKIKFLNKQIKENETEIKHITSRSDFVSEYIDSI